MITCTHIDTSVRRSTIDRDEGTGLRTVWPPSATSGMSGRQDR